MIQSVFVTQLRVHPVTFATACEMYRKGDTPLTVVACWWIAFKFEETNSTITVGDLHSMFPSIVDDYERSLELRRAERTVLERQNFCIPYKNPMRDIYDLLPPDRARQYHDWLTTLQDYGVLCLFSARDWVKLLTVAVDRIQFPTALQLLSLTFRRRHRQRLCPSTPRIGLKRSGPTLATTSGIKRRRLHTIRIIDTCSTGVHQSAIECCGQ